MILKTLLLLMLAVNTDHRDELAFVQKMQTPSGGFISNLPDGETAVEAPTLRTTRTAIRAHRLLGGQLVNREAVVRFLYGCYDSASGGFSAQPGLPPDPISTSVGLMICKELKLPTEDLLANALRFMNDHTKNFEQVRMVAPALEEFGETVPQSTAWLSLIAATRNADGSFGSGRGQARSTALYAVAEMRLRGTIDKEKVVQVLQAGQRTDGGFGNDESSSSDLESCYRVVRLLHRLGSLPASPELLRQFLASCKNADGGYGRAPNQPSSLHGTYYATIIRLWLDTHLYDFDGIMPGALPPSWSVDKALVGLGSQWEVIRDSKQPHGNMIKQTSSEGRSRQFNLCISDQSFQDMEISVEVRAESGKIDQGGGLVWRYLDVQNYYTARWNPLESNFRMYKVVDGVRTQLDTAQAVGDLNQQHTLRIVNVGRDLRGYFDEQLLLEAEDDQFSEWGRIGLWTKADAVTEFDNLRCRHAEKFSIESL